MPMGTFGADHLEGDLAERTFTLNGNATLRIEQNGIKGQSR
jgi:lipopolysaccharide export system protein LptC